MKRELFNVLVTRKEFLKLPMNIRRRVLKNHAAKMMVKEEKEKRATNTILCCEAGVRRLRGADYEGNVWRCTCGKRWVYIEDEAEGGGWHRDGRRLRKSK